MTFSTHMVFVASLEGALILILLFIIASLLRAMRRAGVRGPLRGAR